jgi:hypothetical protein
MNGSTKTKNAKTSRGGILFGSLKVQDGELHPSDTLTDTRTTVWGTILLHHTLVSYYTWHHTVYHVLASLSGTL